MLKIYWRLHVGEFDLVRSAIGMRMEPETRSTIKDLLIFRTIYLHMSRAKICYPIVKFSGGSQVIKEIKQKLINNHSSCGIIFFISLFFHYFTTQLMIMP